MQKTKTIHITYIGRLEREKGIEIVIDAIKRGITEERDIIWHICGDGSYLGKIRELDSKNIETYGHISHAKINSILVQTDFVIMPSLFLETFGLVALETLSRGVPVVGFSQGGLRDFIHPDLILDMANPVDSLFEIIDHGVFPLLDISSFSFENWKSRLAELTAGSNKILLINDYVGIVGGAEQYVQSLLVSLQSLGKTVEIFGYRGNTNKWLRIYLMMIVPIAFWRGIKLSKKIREFNPDLIWTHSLLRYIGPYGVQIIGNTSSKKYITHHDLGLITPRPSQIYNESDIPNSPNLADWMPKKVSIYTIVVTLLKWSYIQLFWSILSKNEIYHILPASWMFFHYQKYSNTSPIVFPHSIVSEESDK